MHTICAQNANSQYRGQGDPGEMQPYGNQADVYYRINTLQTNYMSVNTSLVCPTQEIRTGEHFARRAQEAIEAMCLWGVAKLVRLGNQLLKLNSHG